MNAPKLFGNPSTVQKEQDDLKYEALENSNLAISAAWVLGVLLVVVVIGSVVITG